MINELLQKIKSKFEKHNKVDHLDKTLQDVQQQLEEDLNALSKTHHPHAVSIVSLTKVIVHETLSDTPNENIIESSKRSVMDLVRHFEIAHPRLTHSVENFLLALSNLGI